MVSVRLVIFTVLFLSLKISDRLGPVFQGAASGVPNRQSTWTYNQFGQVLTENGPRTDITDQTTYTYYTDTTVDHASGDLQRLTNPAGHVTQYTKYDKAGRVLIQIGASGTKTETTYTPRGWVATLSVTPGGSTTAQVTTYSYDKAGLLKSVAQPDGTVLSYTYDPAHRLIAETDQAGNVTAYTLDNAGNRVLEEYKNAAGAVTRTVTRSFDALGRLQSVTGASK
jgi:YD repeat-containing protein